MAATSRIFFAIKEDDDDEDVEVPIRSEPEDSELFFEEFGEGGGEIFEELGTVTILRD